MAGLGFMGGLGAAGNGFMEGMNQAEDRKALLEERAYLKSQRQRKLDEQAREDKLRSDIQGVATTEDIEVPDDSAPAPASTTNENGVTVTPVRVPGQDSVEASGDKQIEIPGTTPIAPTMKTVKRDRQQDAIWRDYAKAYQAQGDIAKAAEFNEKADKYAFQRTGRQVNEVLTGGGDLFTKAQRAADLFDKDPFGGGVKGAPIKNEDGSVTLNLYNKENPGKVFPKTFKNERELAESLQSHYSPETYAKIVDARIKAQENAMDPSKRFLRVGNSVYDTATQTFQSGPVPPGFVYDGEGADGQPRYVRGGTGGGSGAGAGSGSGSGKGKGVPADATSAALSHFDSVVQHSEDKLPIDQASQARDYVSRLATTNPNMPPAMVSRVAIAAAKDPNKLVPAINPDTGLIDTVFDDGQNGKITFNTGVGSAAKPGSIKPEQLQQMTTTLLASKSPQEKAELVAAANDPKARGAIEDRMRQQAAAVIAQKTQGLNEQQAAVVTQQINDALETKLGYLGNNLDMIAKYGERPPAKKTEGGSKITQPGGMPKYSGLSGKQLDAAVNADAQAQVDANRGRAQEVEKARKAAAADPELLKLEQERSAMLRKGDAVGANSKIAEYNKLKKERYGL